MARGHGRPHNFFQGGQSRLFAYIFQVANADDQVCNQAGEAGNCPPPKIAQQENISWLRPYDDAVQMPDINKTLYAFSKIPRCRSRQFFGCAKDVLSEFPKYLPEKRLCDKHSPCKLSVPSDTLCFCLPCCHRLENGKFGT